MNFEFNLEESNYVGEGESIEDALFRVVAKNIENSVATKVIKSLEAEIPIIVENNLKSKIEIILDNFMEKPVVVSNGYKTEKYNSILDMVESKFTAIYNLKLSGNSCDKDLLLTRISNEVKSATSRDLDQMKKILKTEAAKIARNELEKSDLAKLINIKILK